MPLTLEAADLEALGVGFALLGAGGGGSPHVAALILRESASWPITINAVDELDPETPCVAISYVGSTLLLEERLPDEEPFAAAIAAVERWLGVSSSAVCTVEAAGLNGLAALQLAGSRDVVDADCMGRALPDLDQISLIVDRLPGLVTAVPTGSGGVALVHDARPDDVETVLRSAISCNGGWAGLAIGGFSVGDLKEHAILGNLGRAFGLGVSLLASVDAAPADLAHAVQGRLLGVGRVAAARTEPHAPGVMSYDIRNDDGDVLRLLGRTEFVAVVRNGIVVASTPTIIVALDAITRRPLEVDEVGAGKDLVLLGLPAPEWWSADPVRLSRAQPGRWGLTHLEETG